MSRMTEHRETGKGHADEPRPVVAQTPRGPVEYAAYGEGTPVLALHGAMGGYDQSLLLARTVGPDGCRYLAVSRPGYLGTPLGARGTPEAQADLCAELLDILGIEQAAVMAISGGGPCALTFALRHKARCRGLILISTCAGRIDTPLPFSYHLMKYLARWPALLGWMQHQAAKDRERAARRCVTDPDLRRRMLADPVSGPLFAALMDSTSSRLADRLPGTANDIAVTRSATYPLEAVAVPVLVVHGTKDPHVPFRQHATELAARIPGAQLLAVDGGEHACLFTHRDLIKRWVARFLAAHAPPVAA